jgi:hypothetical protein
VRRWRESRDKGRWHRSCTAKAQKVQEHTSILGSERRAKRERRVDSRRAKEKPAARDRGSAKQEASRVSKQKQQKLQPLEQDNKKGINQQTAQSTAANAVAVAGEASSGAAAVEQDHGRSSNSSALLQGRRA